MMKGYRGNPPASINNSRVVRINDYKKLISTDCLSGSESSIDLNRSDVLQFFLEDGSKISVRPSGTEPKIKFYFSVSMMPRSADDIGNTANLLEKRIDGIINDMKLA